MFKCQAGQSIYPYCIMASAGCCVRPVVGENIVQQITGATGSLYTEGRSGFNGSAPTGASDVYTVVENISVQRRAFHDPIQAYGIGKRSAIGSYTQAPHVVVYIPFALVHFY